jgi:hypothetical protein
LQFQFRLNCEEPDPTVYDYFRPLASADGSTFYGPTFAGTEAPQAYTLDLANVPGLGDLLGDGQVWIGFLFHADGSVEMPNGAQVDDVVLRVATASAGDNTLAVVSGAGAAGSSVTLPVSLTNADPVKGVQFDLLYDTDVATFTGVAATGRGAGMAVSSHVVSDGRARVVMYHDDSTVVAAGDGAIANLVFEVVGQPAQTTDVMPADIVLSDADGQSLGVAGDQGVVTVSAAAQVPSLQIAVLKNPGRPRTLQVMVNVLRGSGNAPTVTVGGAAVAMSALGGTRYVGTYAVANDAAGALVTASDTNTQGPGSSQVNVIF